MLPPAGGTGPYAAYYAIGRVVTAPEFRGRGLGRGLMAEGLARIDSAFGRVPIKLAAQAHLTAFYASFGFEGVGSEYLEDGIPHLDMMRGR